MSPTTLGTQGKRLSCNAGRQGRRVAAQVVLARGILGQVPKLGCPKSHITGLSPGTAVIGLCFVNPKPQLRPEVNKNSNKSKV